jgi:hypothetical protein
MWIGPNTLLIVGFPWVDPIVTLPHGITLQRSRQYLL